MLSGLGDAEVSGAQVGLENVGITEEPTCAKLVCDNRHPLSQRQCDIGCGQNPISGTRQSARAVDNHLISSASDSLGNSGCEHDLHNSDEGSGSGGNTKGIGA